MSSSFDRAIKDLVQIMTEPKKNKTFPYDTQAEVIRVDGDTAWVHIPGGVDETPVRLTMNAQAGDIVQVRVSGGNAWLAGNVTSPPTDDKAANQAMGVAASAQKDILIVKGIVTESIQATNAKFEYVEADTAKIHNLEADEIHAGVTYTNELIAGDVTTEKLTAVSGYIQELVAEDITAQDIIADHAEINDLDANYAHITNGVIDNAKIGYADVNNLNAHYAEIDMANVNNAWIDHGTMKKAEVFDENVFDVSGDHATIKRIDASKINVANLRADNLIVRRINGQPVVGGYTLIDSNSSGYSSKNPQALGWYEFVNAQWVLSTDTTVDMTKAYYQEGNEVSLYDQQYIDDMENDLQQQIDGAVETFTGSVVPTLTNWPYTDWYDTSATPIHDERAKHVGDIYYVVNSSLDEGGYCYRFTYDNTTTSYDWVLIKDSDVTKALSDISELQTFESETTSWMDETDEGIETIRTNHTALAGVVDKTVKESVQLWFTKANTTAPNKPTSEVTSTSTAGNAWRKVVPAWNASYPNYFYCWQYKFVDNTFGWSAVVRDIAMGETQGTSRDAKNKADAALPASTFTSFESTTFKDVKDTVTEHSTTFTNMTSRLGMNSDGTGANTDIVAKESALETTVDGISTRVGKTETKLIGMYATSSTAEGTAAKVATITPALPSEATWELGTGTIITVKFTNANTAANPTLNVNSKGAKAIKTYANGNLTEAEYKWKAGSTFTFTYNGTNWLMQDSSASVRMNSAETGITQNADAIKLEASRRESAVNLLLDSDAPSLTKINAPDNRTWGWWVSSSDADYCTASFVEMENPPLTNVTYAAKFVATSGHTGTVGRGLAFYASNSMTNLPLKVGTKYTASCWARCTSGSGNVAIYGRVKSGGGKTFLNKGLTSEWKYYTCTVELESTPDYNKIYFYGVFPANTAGTVEICGFKLVAGENVEAYSTQILQTADNVLIKATKNYSKDSSLTDAQNGGKAAIQSLINVAPEGVQISADKVNITGTAVFNAVNSDASAKAAMLNSEIEIGGRNLLRNSGTYDGWSKNNGVTSDGNILDINVSGATSNLFRKAAGPLAKTFNELNGETCVVSFEVYCDDWSAVEAGTGSVGAVAVQMSLVTFNATNDMPVTGYSLRRYRYGHLTDGTLWNQPASYANGEWIKITSKPFSVPEVFTSTDVTTEYGTYVGITPQLRRNGHVKFRNIKWEIGNKATDWTPAPEDVQAEIDNAAKTATNNITTIDSSGIWVTPSGLKPTNTSTGAGATGPRINSSGMQIYKGGTSVAEYGDTARVGKGSSYNIQIDSDSIDFVNNSDVVASISSEYVASSRKEMHLSSTVNKSKCDLSFRNYFNGGSLASLTAEGSNGSEWLILECLDRDSSTNNIKAGTSINMIPEHIGVEGKVVLKRQSYDNNEEVFIAAQEHTGYTNNKILSYDASNNCILGQGQWAQNKAGYNTYVEGYQTNLWGRNKIATNMAITQGSDKRLKKDIKYLEDVKDFVMDLKPVEFKYEFASDKDKHLGFIAQDVEKSMDAYGLSSNKYGLTTEITGTDNIQYKGLNYTEFIPICIKMIQEQQQEIDTLKEVLNEILGN